MTRDERLLALQMRLALRRVSDRNRRCTLRLAEVTPILKIVYSGWPYVRRISALSLFRHEWRRKELGRRRTDPTMTEITKRTEPWARIAMGIGAPRGRDRDGFFEMAYGNHPLFSLVPKGPR